MADDVSPREVADLPCPDPDASPLVPLRLSRGREDAGARAGAPRLYVETYGCQMNVADSDLIVGVFTRDGFARAASAAEADVILINTCAVRERAAGRVLARAAELGAHKRRRPGVVLAIVGCVAEHLREELVTRAPDVDLVVGPDGYRRLLELVRVRRAERALEGSAGAAAPVLDVALDRAETYAGLDPGADTDGVSGFVAIQRGCDKFCTFCVVPFTRGRERGAAPAEVLRQVRALAATGHREVTLLGQTVNSYRHDDVRFSDLLRAVARVDGIERVRFTSPYPIDFTDDVIAAIAEEPKVCRHVHLPLQSGSDTVLERMRRGYDRAAFGRLVDALRAAAPGIAITTDVLVGFCGETEADHAATLAAMEQIRFDSAFLFAYSEREGTLAARQLPDDVPAAVKQRRLAEAIRTQERISAEVFARSIGTVERVLLTGRSKRSAEDLVGRTGSFKAVVVPGEGLRRGHFVDVRITRATSATLFGTPVKRT